MDHRQYATTTRPCMILRCFIILLSIIIMTICGVALQYTGPKYDFEFYYDGIGEFYIGMAYFPTILNMIWETIAFGLSFSKSGFHPGVDIGFEIISGLWSVVYGPVMIWWNADYNQTAWMCESYPGRRCSWYKAMDGFMYGGGALLILSGIFNLTLFVLACRATHLRRRAKVNTTPAPRKEYTSIELTRRSRAQQNETVPA